MNTRYLTILMLLVSLTATLSAQTAAPQSAEEIQASKNIDLLKSEQFLNDTAKFSAAEKFEFASLIYFEAGHYGKAIPLLEVLVNRDEHKSRSELWILLAYCYNRTHQPGDAYDTANIAIILDPQREHYYVERGTAAVLLGKTNQAIEDLERYTKRLTTQPNAHYYLGIAYAQKHEFEQARKHLQRAEELNPLMGLPVSYQLALMQTVEGRYEQARDKLLAAHKAYREHNIPIAAALGAQGILVHRAAVVQQMHDAINKADAAASLTALPPVQREQQASNIRTR